MLMNRPRISPRIKKKRDNTEEEEEEDDNSISSRSNNNSNNEQQQQQQLRGFRRALTSTFSAPSRNRHLLFNRSGSNRSIGISTTKSAAANNNNNNNDMSTSNMVGVVTRRLSAATSSASTIHDDADYDDDSCSTCSDQITTRSLTGTATPCRPPLDTSHTIVLYQPSSPGMYGTFNDYNEGSSLIQSWCQVVHAAHAVWQSREMERLQLTTSHLCYVASRTALQTALLPVTVPLRIVSSSTRCVVDTSRFVVVSASQLVLGSGSGRGGGGAAAAAAASSSLITHESSSREVEEVRHDGLIDLPGRVLGFVGHVTFHLILGRSGSCYQSSSSSSCRPASGQSSLAVGQHSSNHSKDKNNGKDYYLYDHDDFLDRLRLDYYDEPDVSKDKKAISSTKDNKMEVQPQDDNQEDEPCTTEESDVPLTVMKIKTLSETSKFLLRVDDLELYCDDADASSSSTSSSNSKNSTLVLYIDLDAKNHHDDDDLLQAAALSEFTLQGLAMIANHPTVRLAAKQYLTTSRNEIVWKCENSCQRIMRQMSKMSTLERLQTLEKETLVWSGQFRHQNLSSPSSPLLSPSQQQQQQHASRRSMPLYLARGIIRCSPREFVNLLWDNTRTSTYNNFCMGRVTILDLDDSQRVLSGDADTGTKVIQSETRIPFTNMSVSMYCLMHVRPLPDPDEGFVIMSRSLVTGTAGTHTANNSNNSHNNNNNSATPSIQDGNKNEIIWGMNVIRRVPNHPHLTDLTSLSQGGSSLVPKFVFGKIAMMGISEFFDNVRKLDLP